MPSKNIIRVSEFEKLYYDDEKPFKQKHWDTLCKYRDKQLKGDERYFKILNKGIQFTNYVGVIQAGDLTIEVLPKTDREKIIASNLTIENLKKQDHEVFESKQTWHNVLLQMLKECKLLKVNNVDYASLNLKTNSILDIYLELFIDEAETLLHEGLLKRYRKIEGNQTALKGRLVFNKNISQNIVHKERFFVNYTEYNRNNIFNQILYKTLCIIPLISNSLHLINRVNNLKINFPEVSDCRITANTFEYLNFDRKTERYKEALLISKMLLLNYRPDIKGGSENVIAILFDMNKLWEEFIYRRLKKEEGNNITVHRQQSEDFWKQNSSIYSKKIRPDIIIKQNDLTIVLDTKWKIIKDLLPSDEDLKQMFVYNLFWHCNRSILLYPAAADKSEHGDYHDFAKTKMFHSKCSVEIISILKNDLINKDVGKNIMQKIFNS